MAGGVREIAEMSGKARPAAKTAREGRTMPRQ
jgi:hypothetical protein